MSGRDCPRCHAPVPPESPAGLCPGCLVGDLLNPGYVEASDLGDGESEPGEGEPCLRRLGNYRLLETISRGGMGVVFRARQIGTDRIVALKVLAAGDLASARAVRRFEVEVHAAARLEHPNIVAVYDTGEADGERYFSMRLIPGGRSLVGAQVDGRGAAKILAKLADALDYAHRQGVWHRDIKPSNVLLDEGGEPYLADFGLARLAWGGSDLTLSREILGTPAYMAPEQVSGERTSIGTATDIYGLGAVLYELLTGQPPFEGTANARLLRRIAEDDPVRPSQIDPKINSDLETICLKCLEKRPEQRYLGAAALGAELGRWLRHEPIAARPVSVVGRLQRWVRRRPAYAALALLGMASLLVITVGASLFSWRLRETARERSRQLVHLHATLADQQSDGSDDFQALLHLVAALRLQEAEGERADSLRRRIGSLFARNLQLEQVGFEEGSIETAQFSPDGTSLMTAGSEGVVRFRNLTTGALSEPGWSLPGKIVYARFSDDGRRLAVASQTRIDPSHGDRWTGFARVWDVRTRAPVTEPLPLLLRLHRRPMHPPMAFSADGAQLILCRGDGAVHLELPEAGPAVERRLDCGSVGLCAELSHDGSLIAIGTAETGLALWRRGETEPLSRLLPGRQVVGLSFSRNRRRLAVITNHITMIPLGLEGEPEVDRAFVELREPLGEAYAFFQCTFAPNSADLLAVSYANSLRLWDPDSGIPRSGQADQRQVIMARFGREGRLLLSSGLDGSVRLWDAATRRPVSAILRHTGAVFSLDISPDGRLLVTADQNGVFKIWSFADEGERVRRLPVEAPPFDKQQCLEATYSPDGEFAIAAVEGSERAWVSVWETRNWQRPFPPFFAGGPQVRAAFSPDSRQFAFLSGDPDAPESSTLGVRDVVTGEDAIEPVTIEGFADRLRFGPKGSVVAISGSDPRGAGFASIVDLASGEVSCGPVRHPAAVTGMAVSPQGDQVATTSADRRLRIFAMSSEQPLSVSLLLEGTPGEVSWRPDGGAVLTPLNSRFSYRPESATLLQLTTSRQIPLPHQDGTLSAVFDPSGRLVASGGQDDMLRLWDAHTGVPTAAPIRHSHKVQTVAFSRDGTLVAAGTDSGRVIVYDSATGERIAHFQVNWIVEHLSFGRPSSEENTIPLLIGSSGPAEITVALISANTEPAPALERRARLVSGLRLDAGSDVIALSRSELQQEWVAQRRVGPIGRLLQWRE